jgi:hypothetical protein
MTPAPLVRLRELRLFVVERFAREEFNGARPPSQSWRYSFPASITASQQHPFRPFWNNAVGCRVLGSTALAHLVTRDTSEFLIDEWKELGDGLGIAVVDSVGN